MPSVFLNGVFVSRDDARLSVFDAGLQHAVGLFETMLGFAGPAVPTMSHHGPDHGEAGHARAVRVIHLRDHMNRLATSARALGLSESIRGHALADAVERTLAKAATEYPQTSRFRIRLTLTGGDLNLLEVARASQGTGQVSGTPTSQHDPTILIVAQPATVYPAEMFERGIPVVIGDLRLNPIDPFAGHKTLNYWPRLRELQTAASKRAGEAILFQVTNHLAAGCVSNIFLVTEGRLLTPIARGEEQEVAGESEAEELEGHALRPGAVIPSPILPGVVRSFVMKEAESRGLEVERRMLSIDDLLNADEVFLTNSSWGVLPVVKVEREAISEGYVGPITNQLRAAWLSLESAEERPV